MGLFDAKAILVHKKVHTFPKGISPEVNRIARLGFELVYYDVAVQHVSHYAMKSLSLDHVFLIVF